MTDPSRKALATAVLDEYGTTYSEELKIHIEHNTPSPLFQLLCFSILYEPGKGNPLRAFQGIGAGGWTTARKTASADSGEVADVLEQAEYGSFKTAVAASLIECSRTVQQRYGGDLRNLRENAEHDPDKERTLLMELRGMGNTGTDLFFREVQIVWNEVFPFADNAVMEAASRLELGRTAAELHRLVDRDDYVRFISGLVRVSRDNSFGRMRSRIS